MTAVILGVWTTVQYTTSTSTVTVTGTTSNRAAKIVTAKGNAQISAAQSKFGGTSGLFDGNRDYLTVPDSDDWYFGMGDFTIDFWVRFNAVPSASSFSVLFMQSADGNNFQRLIVYNQAGAYKLWYDVYSGGRSIISTGLCTSNPNLTTNTWYHIALVRSGNNWMIFQGGTQIGSTVTDSDAVPNYTGTFDIGSQVANSPNYDLNGWLDEFRVSKGIARWTNNFTPSTSAPTGDSNTVLLLHMDGADGSNTFIDG
jgi:hypothetical protein